MSSSETKEGSIGIQKKTDRVVPGKILKVDQWNYKDLVFFRSSYQ
jgi:hypothetical protein